MTTTTDTPPTPLAPATVLARFHHTAWRWHFYCGLYVVPFLLMLAITGLVMVYFTGFQTRLGNRIEISPQSAALPVGAQAQAVQTLWPGATLKGYHAPTTPTDPSWFTVAFAGHERAVAINPYTGEALNSVDKETTVFAWAEKIHGTLLIGPVGDALIEIASGLALVLIATGVYMHWPRGSGTWRQALALPRGQTGRRWWAALHASVGLWTAVVLCLFLLSGLAWSGVWGAKWVQPWSSFPADKWEQVPTSEQTHAALSTPGLKEVAWGMEQTPLPQSGSGAGRPGLTAGTPINLDTVNSYAQTLGFSGAYRITLPLGPQGVYTISADTMSGDLQNPTQDRYVHIDRHSGRVLADVGFADYSPLAKVMAVGTALHQGDMGLWSAVANVVFCLAVVVLCVSGVVIWWQRRPRHAGRLVAPPAPRNPALWKTGSVVMVVTALAFPLTGAVVVGVLLLDTLVLSRWSGLKHRLG